MNRVRQIKKQTDNRFLNLYEFEAEHRDGKTTPYFVASRAKSQQDLKALCHDRRSDGVIIYGVYGEKKEQADEQGKADKKADGQQISQSL